MVVSVSCQNSAKLCFGRRELPEVASSIKIASTPRLQGALINYRGGTVIRGFRPNSENSTVSAGRGFVWRVFCAKYSEGDAEQLTMIRELPVLYDELPVQYSG